VDHDLSIPGTEVKLLVGNQNGVHFLVALDDRCWHWDSGQWNPTDPFPGGPVSYHRSPGAG
jgi:hypothetical protein